MNLSFEIFVFVYILFGEYIDMLTRTNNEWNDSMPQTDILVGWPYEWDRDNVLFTI